jgi:excisionase family DNA binding protein
MRKKAPPRVGTISWATYRLRYSIPHVRKLIDEGKLRTYGTGHARRISDQAILDFMSDAPKLIAERSEIRKDPERDIGLELVSLLREIVKRLKA